jgi:tetrapyrrole methylase family protein/MazG family protein
MTTLAVPALATSGSLLTLANLVARLRAPDGCPWDREQTHSSLRPYLLEETYEALSALDSGDSAALCEELGDLLLQIALHAQLAVEVGEFSLADVVGSICRKIVRRHPHVFDDAAADTADEVREAWDALKRKEKGDDGGADPLADIPLAMPSLARAQLVQRKSEAAAVRPSVPDLDPRSLDRMPGDSDERAEVIGAALWSVTATARSWGVDAESALRDAIGRYQMQVQ